MHRPLEARVQEAIRPTTAVVDLSALGANLKVVRAACPSSKVFAVVKADAYGHGAVPVALTLEREGVDGFCVALPEEGIELRRAGVARPVLVLGGTYGFGAEETLAAGLTPVVHDLEQVARLDAASRGRKVRVHLKVDTGMSRLGVRDDALASHLWKLRRYRAVEIDGVMSHLACADDPDPGPTAEQLRRFRHVLKVVRSAGFRPRVVHLANSAAALRFADTRFDLVRPGLAICGVSPAAGWGEGLRPLLSFRTEVVQVRDLHPGERVGYGGTFVARRESRIAILPVGYADGVSRRLSGRGCVLVRGARAPVVGSVCMDMCSVDVTDVAGAAVGDQVVLLGEQAGERITADELARQLETVPHEILTSISRRVPRAYVRA